MGANKCDAIGKNGQYVSRWSGLGTLLQPSAGSVSGGQRLSREQGSQQWKHIGVWVECELYIFGKEHCDNITVLYSVDRKPNKRFNDFVFLS